MFRPAKDLSTCNNTTPVQTPNPTRQRERHHRMSRDSHYAEAERLLESLGPMDNQPPMPRLTTPKLLAALTHAVLATADPTVTDLHLSNSWEGTNP